MRLGFDVDGVLANFIPAYQRLCIEVGGRDLFQLGDEVNPPCWNWPEFRGYTREEVSEVWNRIKADTGFWSSLKPLDGADTLRFTYRGLDAANDLYFITSRVGERVKQQTENWLVAHITDFAPGTPTVLISSAKGLCAKALKLDAYLDDNLDNANDVVKQTDGACKVFLLDCAYNQGITDQRITRVRSLGQMLDYLILDL
jgi:hypothetical protein